MDGLQLPRKNQKKIAEWSKIETLLFSFRIKYRKEGNETTDPTHISNAEVEINHFNLLQYRTPFTIMMGSFGTKLPGHFSAIEEYKRIQCTVRPFGRNEVDASKTNRPTVSRPLVTEHPIH